MRYTAELNPDYKTRTGEQRWALYQRWGNHVWKIRSFYNERTAKGWAILCQQEHDREEREALVERGRMELEGVD